MPASFNTRSQSLPPQPNDTPRVTFDKPRALSLDAGYPVHEARHRSVSPARGILKKPETQPDARKRTPSPLRQERRSTSRPRSRSSSVSPEAPTRPRSYSRTESELDCVANACDKLPPYPGVDEQSSRRSRSNTESAASARSVHWPDGLDSDGKQAHHHRGSTMPSTREYSSSLDDQESRDWQLSKQSTVPRLPFQFAEWRDVILELVCLLHRRGDNIGEFVDFAEFERRKRRERLARVNYLEHRDHSAENALGANIKQQKIYGMTMIEMMQLSSTTIVIHGYQHDLPTVIYECVEELYRTGVYREKLFRVEANKHNTDKMRRIFDRGYKRPLGARIGPLADFPTADVCGLLESVFTHTPEPLLPRDLNYGLWEWCVKPVLRYEWTVLFPPALKQARRLTMRGKIPHVERRHIEDPNLTPEERRKVREAFDAPLIDIMRCTLRLLSVENLSLLCYLFDFFKTVVAHPSNDVDTEYISERFGFLILGGQSYAAGRTLMMWMLDRWERITCGLLDIAPPGEHPFFSSGASAKQRRRERRRRQRCAISPNQPYVEGADEDEDSESDHFMLQYHYRPGYDSRRDVDAEVGWGGKRSRSRGRSDTPRSGYVVDDHETHNRYTSAEYIAQLQEEFTSHYIPPRKPELDSSFFIAKMMDKHTKPKPKPRK